MTGRGNASPRGRRVRLDRLELERVVAHGGAGTIGFHRVFGSSDFRARVNFVDYAVLPPGASIGRHRHGDDEELYLVLEGEGTMTLGDEEFRVGPGSIVVNPPGGEHGLVNDSARPLRLFVVELPVDAPGPRGGGRE